MFAELIFSACLYDLGDVKQPEKAMAQHRAAKVGHSMMIWGLYENKENTGNSKSNGRYLPGKVIGRRIEGRLKR
jgi:hypothetical protein